ncbi:uncharacterized protein TNCV_2101461 [Trichonephila clavipes]|nr:uncharacterized protein TNCV_2101461 [Trichonephila clavipes]
MDPPNQQKEERRTNIAPQEESIRYYIRISGFPLEEWHVVVRGSSNPSEREIFSNSITGHRGNLRKFMRRKRAILPVKMIPQRKNKSKGNRWSKGISGASKELPVAKAVKKFTCRNCGGGDRGRVAIYRPFGEVSLSLNRTVTCMVLKANDRRTSCPCHDEFRGTRSDYVRQVALATTTTTTTKAVKHLKEKKCSFDLRTEKWNNASKSQQAP